MKVLHQAQHFTAYQCDHSRAFVIDFGHKQVTFTFCQFLAFRHQVKNIDLSKHFSGENKHGFEIMVLCNRKHIFIFNTHECIALKDLLKGSFTMLELNSVLAASL